MASFHSPGIQLSLLPLGTGIVVCLERAGDVISVVSLLTVVGGACSEPHPEKTRHGLTSALLLPRQTFPLPLIQEESPTALLPSCPGIRGLGLTCQDSQKLLHVTLARWPCLGLSSSSCPGSLELNLVCFTYTEHPLLSQGDI